MKKKKYELPEFVLEDLKKSSLSIKDAEILKIEYYHAMKFAKLTNLHNVNAIRFTYFTPKGLPIKSHYRFKVFTKPENLKLGRYYQLRDSANRLYLPPLTKISWDKIAQDVSIPIYVTEGEKKAAALCKYGYACIAVPGVPNWSKGNKIPIDDWSLFVWKDREVVIVFDTDVDVQPYPGATLSNVQKQVENIADFLMQDGASVWQIKLPFINKDKTGIDDFLVNFKTKSKATHAFEQLQKVEVQKTIDPVIERLNKKHAVIMISGSVCILTENDIRNNDLIESFSISSPNDMRNLYANDLVHAGHYKNGRPKNKNVFDFWLEHYDRREYKSLIFDPSGKCGDDFFNLWRGFSVVPKYGKIKPFLDHVYKVVAARNKDNYRYVLSWLAHIFQSPDTKPGTAIVLRGKQGTGKGIFIQYIGRLLGRHYIQVSNQKHLVGGFNAHLADKLLINADEAFWAGDKSAEGVLKALITEPTIAIEHKGKDVINLRSYCRTVISSNNDWVVPAGKEERRFFVLQVSDVHMQDERYFTKLINFMEKPGSLEALLYYLLKYDIKDFDIRKIPATQAQLEQKIHSFDPFTKYIFDLLVNGELKIGSNSWGENGRGLIQTSLFVRQYFMFTSDIGYKNRSTTTEIGIKLKSIFPKIKKPRKNNKQGKAVYFYQFPSLSECREMFELSIKSKIDWESGSIIES